MQVGVSVNKMSANMSVSERVSVNRRKSANVSVSERVGGEQERVRM